MLVPIKNLILLKLRQTFSLHQKSEFHGVWTDKIVLTNLNKRQKDQGFAIWDRNV